MHSEGRTGHAAGNHRSGGLTLRPLGGQTLALTFTTNPWRLVCKIDFDEFQLRIS